jgi:hypothetical protein
MLSALGTWKPKLEGSTMLRTLESLRDEIVKKYDVLDFKT